MNQITEDFKKLSLSSRIKLFTSLMQINNELVFKEAFKISALQILKI